MIDPATIQHEVRERFMSRISPCPITGCWWWTGRCDADGYGRFWWKGKTRGAHRVAWALEHGEAPPECVLHRCDNPACVNPAHLFIGSHLDNVADRHIKGRDATGDRNGARLHPERLSRGPGHGERMRRAHEDHPESQARGERHGAAKLTEVQVIWIRARHASDHATLRELAHTFGISKSTVWDLVKGKTWQT